MRILRRFTQRGGQVLWVTRQSVSTVEVVILLPAHSVSLLERVLQVNIQSIQASLPLLHQLKEIWQPAEGSVTIRNCSPPIKKIRTNNIVGGIAIITHRRVKTVHLKEYGVDGLEASAR